jgi:hypothetical protein
MSKYLSMLYNGNSNLLYNGHKKQRLEEEVENNNAKGQDILARLV